MEYRKLPKGTEEISVIGFGFIHCIDHPADLERYIDSGALEHIQTLKKQGIVRHIGLSSHTPEIVNRVLDLGILDVVMFSINPAYDYRHGDYAYGGVDERETLLRLTPAEQVGITVMKPFGGGSLPEAGDPRRGLRPVRPLRQAVPLPCGPE